MSVLITTAVLLGLGLWAIGSYSRLLRLRRQVTLYWREVHTLRKRQQDTARGDAPTAAGGSDDAAAARALDRAERLYNLAAAKYNAAIESIPGSLFAGVAGFKRAEIMDRADAGNV